MPNCVCVSDLRVYIRLLARMQRTPYRPSRMNRIIAILASAMLLILVVTVDDSPARAASMNLFPAEGRKSLPRILTTANLLVNRHLSAVKIGEVLAPAPLVRLFRLRGKSEW
jgi:hypothetical protein